MWDGSVSRAIVVLALSALTVGGIATAVPDAHPGLSRIDLTSQRMALSSWYIAKIDSLLISAAHADEAMAANGYAILPTTSAGELITAREVWGMGGEPKPVEAPLAAGTVSPLPADTVAAPQGFQGEPTVHPLQATPAPQMTPVPQDQIAAALKNLFAEREGWLAAPAKPAAAAAPAAANASAAGSEHAVLPTTSAGDLITHRETWGTSPGAGSSSGGAAATGATAASSNDYAILPTTSTEDLFAAREAWGKGPDPKDVPAPLATGSYSPLPSVKVEVPKGFEGEPTVHALQAVPAPQLTPVPQGQIDDAMKKLVAEREGWGMAPSNGGANTAATAPRAATAPTADVSGGAVGHAILPTTSTADLIAAREAWGMGRPAIEVSAPLAAGAQAPLPASQTPPLNGFTGEPTVHALQATPPPQMSPVPQSQIDDAMKKLIAKREGWGNAPSMGAVKSVAATPAAASRSPEAADCEARLRQAVSAGAILFGTSSASISETSNKTLDELASVAKGCKTGRIRVEGHTDSTGRAAFNKSLSEERAKAVASYLTKAGVAADRIEAVGHGQENPIASNSTVAGRAQNRRIEFRVVE